MHRHRAARFGERGQREDVRGGEIRRDLVDEARDRDALAKAEARREPAVGGEHPAGSDEAGPEPHSLAGEQRERPQQDVDALSRVVARDREDQGLVTGRQGSRGDAGRRLGGRQEVLGRRVGDPADREAVAVGLAEDSRDGFDSSPAPLGNSRSPSARPRLSTTLVHRYRAR